jgi:hypothetical protein
MSKVVNLPCVTRLDLPPDRVLEAAIGELSGVVVIGYTKEGQHYFATTYADGGDALWLIEKCKIALLNGGFNDE